jgi:hypothetical protein
MYRHGPSCLKGPVSRARRCWVYPGPEERTPETPSSPDLPAEGPTRGIRHDLVARVRAEIAAGTYDTPEKWEAALDRLVRHVQGK